MFHMETVKEINVVPMLDLAWNLLIVFILTITVSIQGIQVNLPKASAAPIKQEKKTKSIVVAADGNVYVDTYPVTMDQLETYLGQLKATQSDFPVVLKGDGAVSYDQVVQVLALLNKLDLTQISLQTDSKK